MHPSAERLYNIAKGMKPSVVGPSAVARWLNVSPQNMTAWEKRGVSKQGALKAQKQSGYSATWILEGVGPERVNDTERSQAGAVFEEPTPVELEVLDNWRRMHDHDRKELAAEIAKRAAIAQEDVAIHLRRLGLTPRPASASAKAAAAKASTTTEPSRQRPLPLEEPKRRVGAK